MEFTRAMSYHFAPAAGSNNIVDFNELLKQKYEGIKTIYLKKVLFCVQFRPNFRDASTYFKEEFEKKEVLPIRLINVYAKYSNIGQKHVINFHGNSLRER